jgi:hypothetical protein
LRTFQNETHMRASILNTDRSPWVLENSCCFNLVLRAVGEPTKKWASSATSMESYYWQLGKLGLTLQIELLANGSLGRMDRTPASPHTLQLTLLQDINLINVIWRPRKTIPNYTRILYLNVYMYIRRKLSTL